MSVDTNKHSDGMETRKNWDLGLDQLDQFNRHLDGNVLILHSLWCC